MVANPEKIMKNKEKIVLFDDIQNCCGCGGCKNICSQDAITMNENEYGFLYPNIDYSKCINCGMCKRYCAYQGNIAGESTEQALVSVTKNRELLIKSASGGVFATLAEKILLEGGVVCGCAYEQKDGILNPIHIAIDNVNSLYKLQGSKYVQSDTSGIFSVVKKYLKGNNKVLFSGTPCQVAELKHYLENVDCSNLYCIDIICHGVPSAKMFREYLKQLKEKISNDIIDFKFRDKKRAHGFYSSVTYKLNNTVKKKYIPAGLSSYYSLFLKSVTDRENCYSCPYANNSRVGDITIGDYWGIEKQHSDYLVSNGGDLDISNGVSCILVNNEKGKKLIDIYGNELFSKDSSFEKVSVQNEQLSSPSKKSDNRNKVMDMFKDQGYKAIDDWYDKNLGVKKYAYQLYSKMPGFVLKLVAKIKSK